MTEGDYRTSPAVRRQPSQAHQAVRRHFSAVGVLSQALNILVFVLPVYLVLFSDRVGAGASPDALMMSLLMLSCLWIGAIGLQELLDTVLGPTSATSVGSRPATRDLAAFGLAPSKPLPGHQFARFADPRTRRDPKASNPGKSTVDLPDEGAAGATSLEPRVAPPRAHGLVERIVASRGKSTVDLPDEGTAGATSLEPLPQSHGPSDVPSDPEPRGLDPSLRSEDRGTSPSADQEASNPRPRDVANEDPAAPHSRPASARSLRMQQRTRDTDFRAALSTAVKSFQRHFLTIGLFSLAINILILVMPIYLFQISDRVLTSRSFETLIMLSAVVIGAVLLHVLLDVVRRFMLMRVAVQVETALGAPVLSAAIKAAQSGSTREFHALPDMAQLRSFLTGPVLLTMFDAPVAPIYFLAVYFIHPQLGLIVTIAALGLFAFALINQRITAIPFAQASAYSMRASQQAEAMARNAQTVNAMGMIPEGVILWGRETAEALKAQIQAQDLNAIMAGLTKFFRLGTQVTMLGWGALLTLESELTAGMMIAASIIGSRALAPVEGLIEGWRSFVNARSAYSRIKALLQSTPLNQERLMLPRPQGRLAVERALFVPPPTKKVILNGVNFSLEPGQSLAIVGPSGTGKSTIARMLVGAIAPTSGSVRLDLMDIRNWDPRQFGETVGYLAQEVQLFPGSVKANIARMREDVLDEQIFDAAELAGVHDMVSQLPQGYETVVGMDGSPLSGGQRQRVALARAFFGAPRLVVLDEPNSNLDTEGETALAAALMRAKHRQITVVAITQRPALLGSVDMIMLLSEGRVHALGARDEVLPKLVASRSPAPEPIASAG